MKKILAVFISAFMVLSFPMTSFASLTDGILTYSDFTACSGNVSPANFTKARALTTLSKIVAVLGYPSCLADYYVDGSGTVYRTYEWDSPNIAPFILITFVRAVPVNFLYIGH
jgi:hypothetical protein